MVFILFEILPFFSRLSRDGSELLERQNGGVALQLF